MINDAISRAPRWADWEFPTNDVVGPRYPAHQLAGFGPLAELLTLGYSTMAGIDAPEASRALVRSGRVNGAADSPSSQPGTHGGRALPAHPRQTNRQRHEEADDERPDYNACRLQHRYPG